LAKNFGDFMKNQIIISRNLLYGLLIVSIVLNFFLQTFIFLTFSIIVLQIIVAYGLINQKKKVLTHLKVLISIIIFLSIPEILITYIIYMPFFLNETLLFMLPSIFIIIVRNAILIFITKYKDVF